MAIGLGEFEAELESELEGVPETSEFEEELEGEEFLGTIARGIGGLLGGMGEEEITEASPELEEEITEAAPEMQGEEFLGTIARGVGSLLGGLGEEEAPELTQEYEGEYEGEEFLGRIFRGISGFVRRSAPMLRQVARVAAPLVGTAVGGPLGAVLGRAVGSLEGEEELETQESEMAAETSMESESEVAAELAGPIAANEALAEMMAAVASRSASEAEAEAMIGAAAMTVISPRDRAALRRILPHLVRGTAILTRILRQRRGTRPVVRVVPSIVRRTTRTLMRRAASGRPVTRRTAARVMATQTRRLLGSPHVCAAALRRNVRGTRAIVRRRRRNVTGR
jgi:hypothetical protein